MIPEDLLLGQELNFGAIIPDFYHEGKYHPTWSDVTFIDDRGFADWIQQRETLSKLF